MTHLVKKMYRIPADCQVCGREFKARYNVGERAKVCTLPSHTCTRKEVTTSSGRTKIISCAKKCCRSQYRTSFSAQAMDQAIDNAKLLNQEEFESAIKETYRFRGVSGIALRFIAATGCRLGESILVRSKNLRVPGSICTIKIPTLKRIGRPVRTVDLHDKKLVAELQDWIATLHGRNPLLFSIARRTLQAHFSRILSHLKIKKDSCIHILRHTRASQLVSAGASWNYIRQQMGWTNLEMAKIYTHVTEEERAAVARKLPRMKGRKRT